MTEVAVKRKKEKPTARPRFVTVPWKKLYGGNTQKLDQKSEGRYSWLVYNCISSPVSPHIVTRVFSYTS